jgi:hypothetical protein
MSEAVELLKGTLLEKLTWMKAEDANWPNVREKIAATPLEADKLAVRQSDEMKQFFVATCSNDEMADAVTLLGGDLEFKLTWMKAEGADWPRVKALIAGAPEPQRVALRTDAWRAFFVEVCSDKEMAEAVALLGGDLLMKLTWMKAEDTNWSLVKPELMATTDEAQKAAVRADAGMRALFVEICNDVEMAEAVDLLGGDLKFKLGWMKAEDSNWDLIRQKIAATADEAQRKAVLDDEDLKRWILDTVGQINYMVAVGMLGGALAGDTLDPKTVKDMSWADLKTQLLLLRDDVKKAEIRAGGPWVDAFTSVCNNDEMAEAVDILGGDLVFKLSWMKEEGTDWQHVKEKLKAVADDAQKAPLRNDTWRAFFVDICDNAQMAEAVALIGGDLKFKLGWLLEEGTDAELLLPIVTAAPDPEKAAVAADTALCKKLADSAGARVFEALGSGAFVAAALIDQGGEDNAVAALRAIAGVPANVPTIMAELAAQGKVDKLLSNCPTGMSLPAPAKVHFGLIYKNGNVTIPQRKKMIQIRYNVEISDSGIKDKTAVTWGQPQLDAVYEVLGVFPDGSVITNDDIDKLHLVVSGIGTYYPAYDAIHLPGGAGYNMATATWGNTVVVENHFLGTIRHEMGHAIDEQIGGEKWYTTDPNIDWDTWSSVGGWLDSMEELGGWGPVNDDGERDQIRKFVKSHFSDASVNVPLVPPADPNHPFNKYPACPIVATATLNPLEGAHNNFMAMPVIGGRVFTRRPTYKEFYSYQATARVAPVYISNYGLSAPADWFAEQIREYLRTTPPGANTAPFVANYFRMNLK